MRIFLDAIFGQILLNTYIFRRGYQALPPKKGLRIPFVLFFVLELLLYYTGYFFYKDLPDMILVPIMMICNTWYIASLYVSMGLIMIEPVRLSNRIRPWYPEIIKKNWSMVKLSLFAACILAITCLMISGYHHANNPAVRHVNIHIPKKAEGRDSLTMVLMSDLHIGESVRKNNVQRFVALCNAERPDMVVIAGDIMDFESRHAERQHIEEDLQLLNAPLGVYMVLGNHEYRANRFAKLRWLEKTGGIMLIDSVATPDNAFYLIGRDDLTNRKRAPLETLMQGMDLSKPVFVVDHQPEFAGEAIENVCDLALFGHAHNGQFWPFPHFLKLIFEFPYGYFKKGNTHLYVSSGIGFAGPPYRIGTRSELVVLHIQFTGLL